MAKVFLTGATGVAGRPALRCLLEGGHDVTAVVRGAERAAMIERAGARAVSLDLFDADAVRRAVDGHDVICNLVTKIPPVSRMGLDRAWAENDRLRRHVSRGLVDAALATGAQRYVQESIAFIYEDRGGEWIDEDVALRPPPHARTAVEAEGQAQRFTDGGGVGIVLRFGQFYAPGTVHMNTMLKLARRGLSPFLGPPDAYLPQIHGDDIGTALTAALAAPAGAYNVADDEPLTRAELAAVVARAVGRARLRPLPPALLRLGGAKAMMYLRSQRVSNARFKEATGWVPAFRDARQGMPAVVEAMGATPRGGR
jgi:nucleoside-diphosphate-sugar epimerase